MVDQAFKLRELIQSAGPPLTPEPAGPQMVVVSGGRAGVGTTTVAANLAAVLADCGERVVLIDAAMQHANLAHVAGARVPVQQTVHDVAAGDCAATEALVPSAAGAMVLAGGGRPKAEADFSRQSQQRLLAELRTLHRAANVLVVDAGAGLTPWSRRFWLQAKLVLLVTTADDQALLDTYAAVKRSARDDSRAAIHLLANQCDSDRAATEMYRRFSAACQRFLSRPVEALPAVPRLAEANDATAHSIPRVWEAPNTSFGHAVLWLGSAVGDLLRRADAAPQKSRMVHEHKRPEFSPC